MKTHILHIGTDREFRGGENQIRLLIENSNQEKYQHSVAYPNKTRALSKFHKMIEVCPLASTNAVDPRSVLRLIRFCKKNGIHVLHAHSSKAMSLAMMVKRLLPSMHLIVHRRVDFPLKNQKYLSPMINHYIAISNCIEKRLHAFGVSKNITSMVYSAIDTEVYSELDSAAEREILTDASKQPPDEVFIGMASAITGEKGHKNFLNACAMLKTSGVSFHAFIAGDGSERAAMETLAADLSLQKEVTFMGHLKNIPGFLSALDLLAVPSESEGLGSIVLEGFAAGCAVVGTNVGGIPEMIRHQETGLLSPNSDIKGLYENLKSLIEDESLRRQLNSQAQIHMKKNFSLNSMVSGVESVYEMLVKPQ